MHISSVRALFLVLFLVDSIRIHIYIRFVLEFKTWLVAVLYMASISSYPNLTNMHYIIIAVTQARIAADSFVNIVADRWRIFWLFILFV